jgi:hypothetical protein
VDERESRGLGRLPDHALSVANPLVSELVAEGAGAVVAAGSYARGEAGPESDLDLLAVGDESYPPRLDVRDGLLVSVSSQPPALHRESFELPGLVCEGVPGWRDALVLHDPEGIAAGLVREARLWTWGPLARRCDDWVAEELTARAETVHKLASALAKGRLSSASVKRDQLATRLARAMAVRHRLLYGSEELMWELVAGAMGVEWDAAQRVALGQGGGSLKGACRAALRMYVLASTETMGMLDERQGRVVRARRAL